MNPGMTTAKFVRSYVSNFTKEACTAIIWDTRELNSAREWEAECEALGYAKRWVDGEFLPDLIKGRIVKWIRSNPAEFYRKNFEILATALEKDRRDLLGIEPQRMAA